MLPIQLFDQRSDVAVVAVFVIVAVVAVVVVDVVAVQSKQQFVCMTKLFLVTALLVDNSKSLLIL